ncbi:hypothetical protein ACTWPT_57310 [Nonomuraea sp. 3N208]|uniref:hypothetical protein n=1 Tax=Nonomuraea sp. 3N208 TaxID=3457421 RepID=UPI003FD0AF7F
MTGDPGTSLPVSFALWEPHPYRRTAIASLWAEIGPAAAEARPLLLAELVKLSERSPRSAVHSDT